MLTSKASRTNFSPLKGTYCAQELHNSTEPLLCLVYHLQWRQNGAASNLHNSSTLKPQLKAALIPLGYEHLLVSGSYLCMCTTRQSYVLFSFLLAALMGSQVEFNILFLIKKQRSKLVFISELPTFMSSYNFCILWPYFGLAYQLSLKLYQKTWILPYQEIKKFGKNTPYLLDGYPVTGYGSDQPGSPCHFVPIN